MLDTQRTWCTDKAESGGGGGGSRSEQALGILPRHPLGVKPAGNALTNNSRIQRPLESLSDETLLQILELLDVKSVLALSATCRAFYAFGHFDDLWRTRCIESGGRPHKWHGSWYASLMGIPQPLLANISADGLASDALYRPYLCAHTDVSRYASQIPATNMISRLSDLSRTEFQTHWVDKPFILTQPVTKWPINESWTREHLLERYKDVVFRAEAVDWPLSVYAEYMDDNNDESPLYLFDRRFVEKMNLSTGTGGDFWAPECFGDDLFAVLGDQRPDSRWLIIGPERSGSTFHKDPNATSAWNAVVRGSKYWIMFPGRPGLPSPPGVFVSADQSEVTSPLSIAEWLLCFHQEARESPGCKEGICHAGEVLHVPSGWWHLVVNIEPSIAITQNFVPEAHLSGVLRFLRDRPDQVSGFPQQISEDPYTLFRDAITKRYPELAARAKTEMGTETKSRKRKWNDLVHASEVCDDQSSSNHGGFSFGFFEEDNELSRSEISV